MRDVVSEGIENACNVLKEVRAVKSLSELHGLDAIIITAGYNEYKEIPSVANSDVLVMDLVNVVKVAKGNVNVLKFYSS